MADMCSPTIINPNVLNPVAPVIEDGLLGLTDSPDHSLRAEMEARARQYNLPIFGPRAGSFIETLV